MKDCNEINRELKILRGRVAVLEVTMQAVIDSFVTTVAIPNSPPLSFRPEDVQIEDSDLPPFQ